MYCEIKKTCNIKKDKLILISPLDWGLGHASRCIPIIVEFLNFDCKVVVAAPENIISFYLKEKINNVEFELIEPSNIVWNGKFSSVTQLNKIVNTIKKDTIWCNNWVEKYKPDIIISDNRYGMYSFETLSIIITHQIYPISPLLPQLFNFFIERQIRSYLKNFKFCWIPDTDMLNLSGILTSKRKVKNNGFYQKIGLLSRFHYLSSLKVDISDYQFINEQTFDIVVIISGPEPQRSIFENIILRQVKSLNKKTLILTGKPHISEFYKNNNVFICSHLNSYLLYNILNNCDFVIARSGYSTIMDLCVVGCKAVLVPTPGQSEQEYLAYYLKNKGFYYSMTQNKFDINKIIDVYNAFPGYKYESKNTLLRRKIKHLLDLTECKK